MPVEAVKHRCYQVRFMGIKQIIPIQLYSHKSAMSNLGSKFNLLVLDSDNSDNTCCATASQGTAESTRLCGTAADNKALLPHRPMSGCRQHPSERRSSWPGRDSRFRDGYRKVRFRLSILVSGR